jgi:hypothetical protein
MVTELIQPDPSGRSGPALIAFGPGIGDRYGSSVTHSSEPIALADKRGKRHAAVHRVPQVRHRLDADGQRLSRAAAQRAKMARR